MPWEGINSLMGHTTSEKAKATHGSWEVELFNRWKTQTLLRRRAEMLRSQPRTLEKEGWAAQGPVMRWAQRGTNGNFVRTAQARWPWWRSLLAVTGAHHKEVRTDSGQNSSTGCVCERKKGGVQWACGAEVPSVRLETEHIWQLRQKWQHHPIWRSLYRWWG